MLHTVVAGLHFVAWLLVAWLGWCGVLSLPGVMAASLLVAISAGFCWRRRGAMTPPPLRLSASGVLAADFTHGRENVEVLPSSVVTPVFTVLRVRARESRRRHVWLLLPDVMAADDYRRLRVWLKWGGQ